MATAWPAAGTTLEYSTDTGTTWKALTQIVELSNAGGAEIGERDTTHLGSLAHSNAPSIPDNGECTFTLNFDPTDTNHQQLRTWSFSPPSVIPKWKATFATDGTDTAIFQGWVKNFDGPNAGGIDENLTAEITIRVSGGVTWASTA